MNFNNSRLVDHKPIKFGTFVPYMYRFVIIVKYITNFFKLEWNLGIKFTLRFFFPFSIHFINGFKTSPTFKSLFLSFWVQSLSLLEPYPSFTGSFVYAYFTWPQWAVFADAPSIKPSQTKQIRNRKEVNRWITKHYENTPIQIYRKFQHQKLKVFW